MRYVSKIILLASFCILPLQATWYDICVDAGHCGITDPGALGVNGAEEPDESDFNLSMAGAGRNHLWRYGWDVLMTRHTETGDYVGPVGKAKIANGLLDNDVGEKTFMPTPTAVSMHNNGHEDPTARGTETYYWSECDKVVADEVHDELWANLGLLPWAQNRGVKRAGFVFLRCCLMPVCLTEALFTTHVGGVPYGQWYQLWWDLWGVKGLAGWHICNAFRRVQEVRHGPCKLRLVWEPPPPRDTDAKLVWHPTEEPDVTYSIYRRAPQEPDFSLIQSGVTDTTYTDNSTSSGLEYSYFVKAVDGSNTSPRSNILSIQTPPFYSDDSLATAYNNGKKIIFDNEGLTHFVYASDTSIWFSRSMDYGSAWSPSQRLELGIQAAITLDSDESPHVVSIGSPGLPDIAYESGDDTTFAIFYSQHLTDSTWKQPILHVTNDSILSASFDIDPLDTGWVVFNVYDDAGNNSLKIGQFCTQSTPESLENVTTLDTYTGYGKSAVAIRDESIWIIYDRNGFIMCKWRSRYFPFWITILVQGEGIYPCLSVSSAGDFVHFIWEKFYPESERTEIQTTYTNGGLLAPIQTIAVTNEPNTYPYIEKGAVAVWSDFVSNGLQCYWEVFRSQRDIFGFWSPPQNISQTTCNSRYPQVAMYQTGPQTNLVHTWTEGSVSPYEVKILPVLQSSSLNPIPLYALNLGGEQPTPFLIKRDGYVNGAETSKESGIYSADYSADYLHYRIKGLDNEKTYMLQLTFYQNETNGVWQQEIEVDNCRIKKVELPRNDVITEKIILQHKDYEDGVIEVKIKKLTSPKAVLSAITVFEFSKNDGSDQLSGKAKGNGIKTLEVFAFPNPFKQKGSIHYQLPHAGEITIKIYSASGQLTREIKENKQAGQHTAIWDGKNSRGVDIANGVYFYIFEAASKVKTGKIILLR